MPQFLGSPKIQCFDTNTGTFLSGGFLYAYSPGTSTPINTYPTIADAIAGTNANANPVVLDSRGEATVVLQGATTLVLKDPLGNTIWTVPSVGSTSTDILDSNGNELLKFTGTSSAVNEWTILNASTGNSPQLNATGGDTNVGAKISSKGSGVLYLDGGSTGTVDVGTTSTGNINLKRSTSITGDLTVSGAFNYIPSGAVMWYAIASAPAGWLTCDGTAISRTTYAVLFAAIGTTFGTGDGSTTFNLPDQARRTLVGKGGSGTATLAATVGSTGGAETHTLTVAEMPAHTHTYSLPQASTLAGGAVNQLSSTTSSQTSGSTGGDGAHNNMQPSLVMNLIIKV